MAIEGSFFKDSTKILEVTDEEKSKREEELQDRRVDQIAMELLSKCEKDFTACQLQFIAMAMASNDSQVGALMKNRPYLIRQALQNLSPTAMGYIGGGAKGYDTKNSNASKVAMGILDAACWNFAVFGNEANDQEVCKIHMPTLYDLFTDEGERYQPFGLFGSTLESRLKYLLKPLQGMDDLDKQDELNKRLVEEKKFLLSNKNKIEPLLEKFYALGQKVKREDSHKASKDQTLEVKREIRELQYDVLKLYYELNGIEVLEQDKDSKFFIGMRATNEKLINFDHIYLQIIDSRGVVHIIETSPDVGIQHRINREGKSAGSHYVLPVKTLTPSQLNMVNQAIEWFATN